MKRKNSLHSLNEEKVQGTYLQKTLENFFFLSYSPGFCKIQNNVIFDWLNQMDNQSEVVF